MRLCIKKKNSVMKNLKQQLKEVQNTMEEAISENLNKEANANHSKTLKTKNSSTQTTAKPNEPDKKESMPLSAEGKSEISNSTVDNSGWELKPDEEGKSIADQVKEAAQSALQQSGMVYVESAGMYYDYKTGYYYNSELGLYYHTDTNCYYYYNEDKKEFAFHSYPDRRAVAVNPSLEAHEKRKARKQRKAQQKEEEINSLAKSLSQGDGPHKPKRRKKDKEQKKEKIIKKEKKVKKESEVKTPAENSSDNTKITAETDTEDTQEKSESAMETDDSKDDKIEDGDGNSEKNGEELEDGECSDTASEEEEETSDEESNASTASLGDDDMVAKHHPPCMRVIVRETTLPKLKVGSLFLITKDGGTVGREGEHTILLRDANVSRNHLEIKYDINKRMYTATDLGSKNGSFLNGVLMSESQVVSLPMEVIHGSILQLGETKLLCHIHPGNDTCGHCEPGLIMETQEKEKVAYTRTCDVKKQYELELARLKNKYKPEPLMIEDGSYNDRAKARRETVGSSHSSEKTQATDTETHIAPENKGFKLLQKMGWSKGEGLGKDSQGDTAPIPLVSNEGKVGLGGAGSAAPPVMVPLPRVRNTLGPATLRLATKSKLLQAPAKAFQDNDEEESE
ncbi:hypothetical protein O0L34_g7795 [Tuta absoluta]|nr:hypothetical protein O0L34_g7795 [Tuta absoluta]